MNAENVIPLNETYETFYIFAILVLVSYQKL